MIRVQDTLSSQLPCWSGTESVLVDDCLLSTVTGLHNPYLQLVCRQQALNSICVGTGFTKGASYKVLQSLSYKESYKDVLLHNGAHCKS